MFSIDAQAKYTIQYSLTQSGGRLPASLPHTSAREGRTLLDQLNHRNELASIINLVTFKASAEQRRRSASSACRGHSILTTPDGELMKIRLMLAAETLPLES
jgi:hypothetical protein